MPHAALTPPPASSDLNQDQVVELAQMFRLMGDPTRLRIILACLHGPMPVTAIAEALGLTPSLVSHHLRLLRASRILRGTRRGKQIFYASADDHISRVVCDMLEHVAEPAAGETT